MNATNKNRTYQSRFDGARIVTDRGQRYTLSNSDYIGGGRDGEVFQLNSHLAVKMYSNNPIDSVLREKLLTLCGQNEQEAFHELVVSPIQMIRLEKQTANQEAGFIMKYLPDAKPLSDMRWKNSIKPEEEKAFDQMIANIIYDLSDGLENLHANRVFMCDLKPDNILVSNLRPYLIDFDSCSMPNYPGETFTIPYLDPRIRDGVPNAVGSNEEFSDLTDWWALAVIAFELFMGVLPWAGIHPQYRKDPLAVRSFNYSAVIFDPMVRTPKFGMRDPRWLEEKPKIKEYFKRIFSSPEPAVPIVEILNTYFPREEFPQRPEQAINLIDKLVGDARQIQFFKALWDAMIEKARERASERKPGRINILDVMYSK